MSQSESHVLKALSTFYISSEDPPSIFNKLRFGNSLNFHVYLLLKVK